MKNSLGHEHSRQARNLYQWHVQSRRFRRGRYLVLHVEKLESRSLLAGDLASLDEVCDEPLAPADSESESILTMSAAGEAEADHTGPVVDLILQLTNPDGSPLTSLAAGQDFVLHVLADDLRASAHGIFSAYLDLRWDSALAEVAGPLEFSADFPNLQLGDASIEAGVIDEGGAFGSFAETGPGAREIFSVPLRALGAGDLVITSDAAETPINQVLAYGLNEAIAPEGVRYGETAITIEAAPVQEAPIEVPAEAAPADEPAEVVVVESASENVALGDVDETELDEALEQLILGTLAPTDSPPVAIEAATENPNQSAAAPSAPNLAELLAGAKLSSAAGSDEEDGDSEDEESEEDATDVDATALNLL